MKTINLRDDIYHYESIAQDRSLDWEVLEEALFDAVKSLKEIQDVLIGLTDEDWDKLNLDVEFVL